MKGFPIRSKIIKKKLATNCWEPDTEAMDDSRPQATGELTDAPVEDDLLHENNANNENGNQ